ncbi:MULTISPECIES: ribosomal protein S18-alanine N-acetyltransferase [Gammaproteobacteria]|uniref:ribosomal protein S18-alanine N-acetyltransferase n=1 Tax=Gammaproteobacteria TaxID=1236 RepID=UPI000DCF8ED2|nr:MULTISPECIES: ribosomal protein S18-alanine N-acetyltransferase [Gammaproteobacteria]RTE86839.1 ribosomal-protein-alanine N-acetyltransferase [Aliidiomarina sp. B3213]TCZ93372.1 ribosomal-protein-alanine N-acetyltransferase [Lysobacter sp. N42]
MIFSQLHEYSEQLYEVECTAHPLPWKEKTLAGCFSATYDVVALFIKPSESEHDQIAGFYICQHVADEVTLMNIAVHPKFQGKGLGSALLNDMLMRYSDFSDQEWQVNVPIYLEVRESNTAAIRLYERYGFKCLGSRPGYYPPVNAGEPKETALVYARLVE